MRGCTVRKYAGAQVGGPERVDGLGRGAQFGELRRRLDLLLVDTEFFAQLAERRRGVVFPIPR
ncbi:hypothetical protein PV461_18820 [Streptomyces scabiei]|nr:hypothetical protein [Streptomyces scabiei]MDX3115419.1 hypothetical protein [Streptomyces scabiei]